MSEKPKNSSVPPASQFQELGRAAGLALVDGDGPPVVRIESDLNITAKRLGEIIGRLDLYERDGEGMSFFDHKGRERPMTARTFRTWLNDHVIMAEKFGKEDGMAIPGILSTDAAATILESVNFRRGVRTINAVNQVRLPIVRKDGLLELLPEGYDEETGVFTVASGIKYELDLDIEAAKAWLDRVFFLSFPFTDERSKAVQVAAMLALYAKHLPGAGGLRPGFLWIANKAGTGKSVLAKAALFPVLGDQVAAMKMKAREELDKEIEAFLRGGAPYIFLDNVYSKIQSATIDQMLTNSKSAGRAMGGHGTFVAKNSALLLVTGNQLELNEDAARRFLVVDLFDVGDPLERKIPEGSLLDDDEMQAGHWRKHMLSCLWALVKHWHDSGMPAGSKVLGSFEKFSKLMGGIVEAAGYSPPFERAVIPDAIDPAKAEYLDLMRHVLAEMNGATEKDFTLESLACLARAADLYQDSIGTLEDGRKLTAKEDGVKAGQFPVEDRGILTPSHRSAFSKKLKKLVGDEPRIGNIRLQFGQRSQSRKATYTIKILTDESTH